MLYWMIVYPAGDRTRLCIAQVWSYERGEYALASERYFENTNEGKEECREYMIKLADKHDLDYSGKKWTLD